MKRMWKYFLFIGMVLFPIVYNVIFWEELICREPLNIIVLALIPWYIFYRRRKRVKINVV